MARDLLSCCPGAFLLGVKKIMPDDEKKEGPAGQLPGATTPEQEETFTDVPALLITRKQDAERVELFRQMDAKIKAKREQARVAMVEAGRAMKEVEVQRKEAENILAKATEEMVRAEEKAKFAAKFGTPGEEGITDFTQLLEELNQSGQFSDAEYLTELLQGGDLKYLKSVAKECGKKGFPATPVLTEYLFLTTVNHRLHIEYMTAVNEGVAKSIQDRVLRIINENQERISKLEESLTKLANDNKTGVDVTSLHQTVLEEGEKFIRAHVGEFSFMCNQCNTVVMSDGLPHWALRKGTHEG